MKNFVKAKYRENSECAVFEKFPRITIEKLDAGIFEGSQIKEHIEDPILDEAL